MSNILFPPAGTHPAAYSHAPSISPRPPSAGAVAPVAQSAASGFQFTPDRGAENERRSKTQKDDENRSAPPTVLQIKIDSMLREQAEARQAEMAHQAIEKDRNDADAKAAPIAAQERSEREDAQRAGPAPVASGDVREDNQTSTPQESTPSDNASRNAVFSTLP